jgi:hypothetical protein
MSDLPCMPCTFFVHLSDSAAFHSQEKGYPFYEGSQSVHRHAYGGKVGLTTFTTSHPWTSKMLALYAQQSKPSFMFSSIQVILNGKAKPHVDANNLGPTLMRTFGKYSGGELFHHDPSGDTDYTVKVYVNSHYKNGMPLKGFSVPIKSWYEFDGRSCTSRFPLLARAAASSTTRLTGFWEGGLREAAACAHQVPAILDLPDYSLREK